MSIRLAEFQVRLLLCKPASSRNGLLLWNCGCSAEACGHRKYDVFACSDHAALLCHVREDDEPSFDWISEPVLRYPSVPSA